MMTALAHLAPVEDDLFYSRHDPNDVRFGDIVLKAPEAYPHSQVVILGCPQDEGVRRNGGRTGSRFAPNEIRRALYRYPVSEAHQYLKLIDVGNLRIGETLEETHEWLCETLQRILHDGKKIIVLGGGNDISYPDCKALCATISLPLVFNIDRHLDVRVDTPRNSGTPYRQLLEEGAILPPMFHEVGTNSYASSPTYLKYVQDVGAHIHYLGDLRAIGVGSAVQSIVSSNSAGGIFLSLIHI